MLLFLWWDVASDVRLCNCCVQSNPQDVSSETQFGYPFFHIIHLFYISIDFFNCFLNIYLRRGIE